MNITWRLYSVNPDSQSAGPLAVHKPNQRVERGTREQLQLAAGNRELQI